MSHSYSTPLELQLLSSRYHRLFIYGVYSFAVISILILPISFQLKLLFVVLLFALFFYFQFRSTKFNRLIWQRANLWYLYHGGVCYEAQLMGDSVRTPWLVILNFRIVSASTPSHVSVIVWSDSVHVETFRRLKVRLLVEGVQK